MMNLSNFATNFTNNISGKEYSLTGTNRTIKGTATGDTKNPNADRFTTVVNLSAQLIQADGFTYLVDRLSRDQNGLWRGILWTCQKRVGHFQYPENGPVDSFGRHIQTERTLLNSGIPIHFETKHTSETEQTPDRPSISIRLTALMQTINNIAIADILKTSDNVSYSVLDAEVTGHGITRLYLEQLA